MVTMKNSIYPREKLKDKKKKKKLIFANRTSLRDKQIFEKTRIEHKYFKILRGCLVCVFKQPFLVFKQHFTYFHTFFHPHVFSQMFSNNNFQFLNTCTKRTLSIYLGTAYLAFF